MPELSERQRAVLRAMVTAYVGEAAPIGSATLSHLLPHRLSAASIRTTLAELSELGLVSQPHTSAGRVPTEEGLRVFIDSLPAARGVSDYDRRTIDFTVAGVEARRGARRSPRSCSRSRRVCSASWSRRGSTG